ncbi:ABC transporter ATP-binding protein [Salinibacterium soli]|uniref:Energy-coupling factor transporter ATPase n=1 Tax=Antiquaquibacter soli TaxID=3064523 RepID=A0ABT9BW69_9MICO|nr:energy-coupling factor transporter ATPase [Protaetiibacter sp. WY-16]MDO7883557.1 energy-coupling factor transporter ATPase [Protaetiibacter sp. WY-16]
MTQPLEVRAVRIRYPDRDAWRPNGVDFSVRPGEVVLVLGPSGCGKSTLALALGGLLPRDVPADLEGAVLLSGRDSSAASIGELGSSVATVFQDPDAHVVTATVFDEVAFGPENLLVPADEVLERTERALRTVGLWERRDDNPDVLSGGGRQRLAIASALALHTPLLVLDEPTANLDPAGIEEVYAALAEVVASGQRSVVLVEHNLDAALEIVDRVVVLDELGRLVLDGPARETLRDNVDRLAALGVWLPVSALAALRLRSAGVRMPDLPLTPAELATSLDALPELPPPPVAATPAVPAEPVVTIDRLTLRRGRAAVLHDVSLSIARGSVTALVGVNGAGKTSLLQAIAGVLRPPRGTVSTHGHDPARADVRVLARDVGFVFQNPEHQFVRATVAEELAHGPLLQGVPADEVVRRVDGMLVRFGLVDHRDVHPMLLSGGQKRRLSVGTALISRPPVLALDEPTFGQDRERAEEILDLLDEVNREGTTIVLATHDLQLVADHASHVAVLHAGRLSAFGPAGEVLSGGALEAAGLRRPVLARAMGALSGHPEWRSIARLADLPGGAG